MSAPRGGKGGVQRPSPCSNCFSRGRAGGGATGWGVSLRPVPAPHSGPPQEPRDSQSETSGGVGSRTGIGAGPLAAGPRPSVSRRTKPGGTRGRAQPQGRGRDCRASGPPPPFPWLGEPPHTARPLARGGAPAFVRTAEHRPLTRAPSWAAAPPYKARPFGPRRGGGGAQP